MTEKHVMKRQKVKIIPVPNTKLWVAQHNGAAIVAPEPIEAVRILAMTIKTRTLADSLPTIREFDIKDWPEIWIWPEVTVMVVGRDIIMIQKDKVEAKQYQALSDLIVVMGEPDRKMVGKKAAEFILSYHYD